MFSCKESYQHSLLIRNTNIACFFKKKETFLYFDIPQLLLDLWWLYESQQQQCSSN